MQQPLAKQARADRRNESPHGRRGRWIGSAIEGPGAAVDEHAAGFTTHMGWFFSFIIFSPHRVVLFSSSSPPLAPSLSFPGSAGNVTGGVDGGPLPRRGRTNSYKHTECLYYFIINFKFNIRQAEPAAVPRRSLGTRTRGPG